MIVRAPAGPLTPPLGSDAIWAAGWTPEEARLAVDEHKRGTFRWSWQLSIDCTSYPPIRAALEQRISGASSLPWTVDGPERAPGRLETEAARQIWAEHLERLVDSTLIDVAMMGFSVWHHPLTVDPDTLRTVIAPLSLGAAPGDGLPWVQPLGGVQRWPLSAVGYTAYPLAGVIGYYAILRGGQRVQLPRPGETRGPWTVIGTGKGGDQPHLRGAVTALDVPFTAGMLSMRARSNLGVSAGRASPTYELPPDVPVRTTVDGKPARGIGEEAADTLAALGAEQTAAIFPHGGKLDKFELTTTGAAEYFSSDLRDSMLMVALAVMGRGGALGKTDAQYQGPTEMETPEALERRDVGGLERGASGLFAELARANIGPDAVAPRLNGHLPDEGDANRVKAEQDAAKGEADKLKAFHAALYAERSNGFEVDQPRIDVIAAACGVTAPTLPPGGLPPVLVKLPPVETTLGLEATAGTQEAGKAAPASKPATPAAAPSPGAP
jgi:hypothetical protein